MIPAATAAKRRVPCGLTLAAWLGAAAMAAADPEPSAADAARRERLEAAARSLLVHVRVYFQRDPEDPRSGAAGLEDASSSAAAKRQIYAFLDEEQALEVTGVVLAPAAVVIADLGVERKFLERFEVTTAAGRAYPAAFARVLLRAPGWALSVRLPAGETLPEPAFETAPPDPAGTTLVTGWLNELDGAWRFGFGSASLVRPFFSGPGARAAWLTDPVGAAGFGVPAFGLRSRPTYLLCNGDGRPVGAALYGRLDADPAGAVAWRGAELRDDPGLSPDRHDALERDVRTACGRALAEVRLTLRHEGGESENPMAAMMRVMRRRGMNREDEEVDRPWFAGLAVSRGLVLVPAEVTPDIAARIESIEVTVGAHRTTGTFRGAFREFAAFLVDLAQPLAEAPPQVDAADPTAQGATLLAVEATRRLEQLRLDLRLTRLLGVGTGYKDERFDLCDPAVADGALVFDLAGRPAGFLARRRKDDERLKNAGAEAGDGMREMMTMRRFVRGSGGEAQRLWQLRDLAGALANPDPALDPEIRVKTREEGGRQVWFGVDLSPLTPEVTRMLKIEGPTKNGAIGQQVVHVYEDSPAAKAGFIGGEIILELRDREKKGEPMEVPAGAESGFDFEFPEELRDRADEDGFPMFGQPWPSARNVVNGFLTALGKGRSVVVTFLKDGARTEAEIVTEEGPFDYEGAPRARHEGSGLSLRDLTYEVRRGLKLSREATGAVIARVEPGMPAAVARLRTYDVILRLDGEPVASAHALADALDAASASARGVVKLQVLRFDKTRFVDLQISEAKSESGGK